MDPISVAFVDQVTLFSDFNRFFELLRPGFAPYDSNAFYMLEKSSKIILKTLIANLWTIFMSRMLLIQSLWVECKVCLSHAGGLRWQNPFLMIVQSAIKKPIMRRHLYDDHGLYAAC